MEHRGSAQPALSGRRTGRLRSRLRTLGSMTTAVALTISGLALAAPAASAAPGPVQTATSGVVTAQALPTVQINGVVWAQVVVGNKVFAGGTFSKARPAGSPAGQNETVRSNLLAYDITTGELDTSFAPKVNGTVRALAVSPDGKRLYVGGDFTQIDGATRSHIASYDMTQPTPQLYTSFLGSTDGDVWAIAALNDKIYIGGTFNKARGVGRAKLAALVASDGGLLGWNPGANNKVRSLVISPDNTRVIAAGHFSALAGATVYGSGAVDAATGASGTWNVNKMIRNFGNDSAITSVSTDGSWIYGTGFVYNGSGNLEGAFSADPKTGTIRWIEDCHGDSYGAYAPRNSTNVAYVVSHAHYCGNVGGQPQTDPWSYQRGMAFTKSVTGTLTNNGDGAYANYSGAASPSIVSWFPQIAMGSYTGLNQGAWSIAGNDQYVTLGGEFPRINGVNQQGLARFAVQPISKGTRPLYGGRDMVPSVQSIGNGGVRVSVTTNWDRDDSNLTYQLVRDLQTVNSATANSTFWNRPKVTVADSGLQAGKTYSYQIRTVDSAGNTTLGNPVSFTVPTTSTAAGKYSQLVAAQGASPYWRLGETSGTVFDWAGTNDGTLGGGVTRGVAGAINDGNAAVTFNGTDSGRMSSKTAVSGPQIYSAEAWFNTTTTTGGRILGFGSSQSGNSGSYDRHIYMTNAGKLNFGNYNGNVSVISSPKSYNDGKWHQVVGTLSRSGAVLYVDGVQVASSASITSAQSGNGYWRIGGDSLAAWPSQPASNNFKGTIDDVSIYSSALTADQVAAQFNASGQIPNDDPVPSFAVSNVNRAITVDGSASSDPDGSIASYAWDFGNGATATGATANYTYPADGTFTVKLTVTDNRGATASKTQPVTVAANKAPIAQFTSSVSDLAVTVKGSGSSDPDGTITAYAWDFGDGGTDSGATPAPHTYAVAGTYPITLTVTDNQGLTATSSTNVAVNAPGQPVVFATDAFARTVTNGLGSADVGGAWTPVGSASSFAVNGSAGTITMATKGSGPAAYLNSLAQRDVSIATDVAVDKVSDGGGINISLAARHTGTTDYRVVARLFADGTIGLQHVKFVNGTQINIGGTVMVPGLTFAAGDTLRMRFQVSGASPTTLSSKVWKVGSAEPVAWHSTSTDSQAELQAAGGVGVVSFLSSVSTKAPVVASFDNLVVQAAQ